MLLVEVVLHLQHLHPLHVWVLTRQYTYICVYTRICAYVYVYVRMCTYMNVNIAYMTVFLVEVVLHLQHLHPLRVSVSCSGCSGC